MLIQSTRVFSVLIYYVSRSFFHGDWSDGCGCLYLCAESAVAQHSADAACHEDLPEVQCAVLAPRSPGHDHGTSVVLHAPGYVLHALLELCLNDIMCSEGALNVLRTFIMCACLSVLTLML